MQIPRPVRRKPLFKRRTSPPPAARKLLLASLLSGVILLGMLAIVFIPRGLVHENLPTLPQIAFVLNTTGGNRVVVSAVSLVRPLSEYNATYSNGTRVFASIHPLTNGSGNADLSFFDVDGDGNLNVGDEFHVSVPYRADAVLRVWYLPWSAIVGYWPPPP